MTDLVRSAALTAYFDVARELGFNPAAVLRRAGLTRSLLRDPEQRIPARAAVDLLEDSAALSGSPTYGLRMAELRHLSDFGVVGLLIPHQPTLRDAVATIIRHRRLLNESLAVQFEEVGRTAVLREELMSDRPARQATELAVAVLFRMCRGLLGERWKPRGVRFTHAAPADLQAHRRVFACRVDFGAEFNGIVCTAAELDAPTPGADPVMARHVERFVETLAPAGPQSIAQEVRRALYLGLPSGHAGIDQVASGLGLSVRTLQRRLDQAGVGFGALLDDVRGELAERYLRMPHYTLGRVSELLGYAMPSAFTRWFGARFGVAPRDWRRAACATAGAVRQAPQAASAALAPLRDAAPEGAGEPVRERARR